MAESIVKSETQLQRDTKRLRTSATGNEEAFETGTGPSKVLHVRNVSPETSHEELVAFVSQFGTVTSICFLSKFQQALVEMDSPSVATAVVMYSRNTPVFIRGKEVLFEYSKSQSINTNAVKHQPPSGMHNILLCTILNPIYNITVDVIWAIMSPFGNVLRIVVFNKNGVQSLVEFDSSYSASQAFTALDGKDIYAGSCTLKIEFSRSEKLNVHVNNDKSRDYTNPSLPAGPPGAAQAPPYGYTYPAHGAPAYGYPPMIPGAHPGMTPGGIPGSVVVVYGLDESVNVDRVFNLFCQYGNVSKIKLITHKKGSGMVQMETPDASDRAIQALNGITLFGQQLSLQYSKHGYIAESRNDLEQANQNPANPSTKDFTNSPLNRFKNHNPNAYKNIYKPTNTLYFSNAPREFQDADITQLFSSLKTHTPTHIRFFSLSSTGGPVDERRVGLLEFTDVVAASEALIIANNTKAGQNTIKLAFTANTIHSGTGSLNSSLNMLRESGGIRASGGLRASSGITLVSSGGIPPPAGLGASGGISAPTNIQTPAAAAAAAAASAIASATAGTPSSGVQIAM